MIKKILFSILVFSSMNAFSQREKQNKIEISPTVYLVGSIHNMHFNPDNHYSVNDLLAQVQALKPDKLTARMFKQNVASKKLSESSGMRRKNEGQTDSGADFCEYVIINKDK